MSTATEAVKLPVWWSSNLGDVRKSLLDQLSTIESDVSTEFFDEVIRYANCIHQEQRRAGGKEYIIHPLRVCLSLLREFEITDPDLMAAAILHDVIEDSEAEPGAVFNEIHSRFTLSIASLVKSVSRRPEEKRSEHGDRYGDPYYERIKAGGRPAILLKTVDKLDNIRDSLNHPNAHKRHVYLKECQRLFIPLLDSLCDTEVRDQAKALLEEAMMNHQFYVDRFRLFNPTLDHWLTRDDVQIVKTDLDHLSLARNMTMAISHKIDRGDFNTLVDVADLPRALAEPDQRRHWNRVRQQCQLLVDLFSSRHPRWMNPVLKDKICLFSLIHSRLLMPANWLFPIWTEDYAVSVLNSNHQDYGHMFGEVGNLWVACMQTLLTRREALWRQHLQVGSRCARAVLAGLRDVASTIEHEKLLSMRLLSEYLDVKTSDIYCGDETEARFARIWRCLKDKYVPSDKGPSGPAKDSSSQNAGLDVEIQGLHRVQNNFPDYRKKLNVIADLVRANAATQKRKSDDLAWVYFNHIEIEKRRAYFETALERVERKSTVSDLRHRGISIHADLLDRAIVLTVEPDKGDALTDRLPETSAEQKEDIKNSQYSAVSIFDTLLKSRLLPKEQEPLWIPRVYRILDTIMDFDPRNVQKIAITLHSNEDIKTIPVCLPIPTELKEEQLEMQRRRKEIVARYIATTIYNYAVTLGIYSATMDCLPVSEAPRDFAFTTTQLEEMVVAAARKSNYELQYGKYIEIYNYHRFSVKQGFHVHLPMRFRTEDMNYGTFLGIDIGGTNTKVCLFQNGKSVPADDPVISFPTFENKDSTTPISAEHFTERLVDIIEKELGRRQGKPFHWNKINGVGISWPGAVRDSRIVGLSRTLARLAFDTPEKRITFSHNSSAADIHSADLAGIFRRILFKRLPDISQSFAVSLENDGNAEAYGNFCRLRMQGSDLSGGTLIIKLGTSLAGGHIDVHGAISPHVAEFSKIILNFNTSGGGPDVQGPARNFISSQGIRDLTRSFKFDNKEVFGELKCSSWDFPLNDSDSSEFRIESVEVGELLNFFELLDDNREKNAFLDELVSHDNRCAPKSTKSKDSLLRCMVKALKSESKMQRHLKHYIISRGKEEYDRLKRRGSTLPAGPRQKWQLGVNRTLALMRLPNVCVKLRKNQVPSSLDYEVLAQVILGSVALFSQLSVQVAHLIASLYNIYKKQRFNQIVLAGGVLKEVGGMLVQRQTEAFLAKFYDKIFGPTKHLKPGSVRLAPIVADPEMVGPFGAAMVANRMHKLQSIAVMEKEIEAAVCRLMPGRSISIRDFEELLGDSRADKSDIQRYLQRLISKAIAVQRDEDTYVKVLSTE